MKKKFAIVTGEPDSINIEIIGKVWKKLKSIALLISTNQQTILYIELIH